MSGMAMEAPIPHITNVVRYGSRGWQFQAVWRQGRPGELTRAFRTSRGGRGLQAFRGRAGWVTCGWLDQRYHWPRGQEQFTKQVRIVMRPAPSFDPRH